MKNIQWFIVHKKIYFNLNIVLFSYVTYIVEIYCVTKNDSFAADLNIFQDLWEEELFLQRMYQLLRDLETVLVTEPFLLVFDNTGSLHYAYLEQKSHRNYHMEENLDVWWCFLSFL